jgi:endonuclease-3
MDQEELRQRKRRARIVVRELKKIFPEMKTMLVYSNPWELLVAVILSAQTTDKQVNIVTKELFKKYTTFDNYATVDIGQFQRDIKSINYYKTKAKHILATAQKIQVEFGGRVPKTIRELITLPGVGRKTANVVLGNAYGVVEGIAVDTHVRRLAQRFGLTKESDPKKIERDLMKIVPKKEWFPLTYRMISYGRAYSPARKKDQDGDIVMRALERAACAPEFGG